MIFNNNEIFKRFHQQKIKRSEYHNIQQIVDQFFKPSEFSILVHYYYMCNGCAKSDYDFIS